MDADDLTGGEAGGDGVEGDAVVGVVEGGDEDERVGDVKVGVAGGEAPAMEDDGRGHGEGDDAEGLACRSVAEGVEAVEVLGEREVVGVGGIGLDAGEDGVGRDEAGDVVDVAVGVVAGAAAGEPEGLVDAEVVAEGAFELGAGLVRRAEAGVALLDFGEEALLGGEQDACAVGVDGAAFEDDAAAVDFGLDREVCRAGRRGEGPGRRGGSWSTWPRR